MTTLPGSDRSFTRRTLMQAGLASAATATLSAEFSPVAAAEEAKVSLQAYDGVKPVEYPWGWIRWLMSAQIDPRAEMTLGLVHIEPNQANPVHVHPNCAEYLHVLSGSCEHRVGDQWVPLKVGDTLRIPTGVVHAARTKDEACRVMVLYNTGARQMVVMTDEKAPLAPPKQ